MKKFLIKILKFIFKPKLNLPEPKSLTSNFKGQCNILIVRQHNQLGDMLLSVSLFRAIKENLNNVTVTVVASPDNVNAIESNSFIDEVILFDKRKFINPLEFIKFLRKLRKDKFQLGIVPTTVSISFTSCLLCRLAKCDFTIGPKSLNGKLNTASFLFDYAIDLDFTNDSRHISDKILDIVRPFGIDTKDLRSHIYINQENRKIAQNYIIKSEKLKVGLHIGAGKIHNRWALNNFSALINQIIDEYNAEIYLTIGPWDEVLLVELLPKIKTKPIILKNLSIPTLAAIIDYLNLFISNDTGIMHVAGATNCPLISLFGPTNPEIWAPIGNNKIYLHKGSDINLIHTNDVMNIVREFLE